MDSANTVTNADARTSMKNARYWLGLTDEAFDSLRDDIQDELNNVLPQLTASGRKADSGGSDVRSTANRPLVDAALDRLLQKWDDRLDPPPGSKDKRAVLWDLFRDAKRWTRPQRLTGPRNRRQLRPAGAPNSQGHDNERDEAVPPVPDSQPSLLYCWSDIVIRIRVISQDSEDLVLMPAMAATSEESRKGIIQRNSFQLGLLMLELQKDVPGFGVFNLLSFIYPDDSTTLPINGDVSLQYALNMTRVSGQWRLDLTAKMEESSDDENKKRKATEEHNSTNGKRTRLVGDELMTLD